MQIAVLAFNRKTVDRQETADFSHPQLWEQPPLPLFVLKGMLQAAGRDLEFGLIPTAVLLLILVPELPSVQAVPQIQAVVGVL